MTDYSVVENLTADEILSLYQEIIEQDFKISSYYVECNGKNFYTNTEYLCNGYQTDNAASRYYPKGSSICFYRGCNFCSLCGCSNGTRFDNDIYCLNNVDNHHGDYCYNIYQTTILCE